MADIMDMVRATLGDKFDAKHVYVVVRPGMEKQPKFRECTVVGEFDEDTRNGTKLIVLRRPEPKPPPPPSAAERVRSVLLRNYPTKPPPSVTPPPPKPTESRSPDHSKKHR